MKKIIKIITLIFSLLIIFSTACNNQTDKLTVYMPDGAPALSMVKNIIDNGEFDYKVVGNDKIEAVVTGRNPVADVCILPINNASNLLSDKEDYYMLGVVTHGNFYFLSKENVIVDKANANNLIGKTIGVVQLANVPGLALKTCLNDLKIPYVELVNGLEADETKVNLRAITPTEIGKDVADIYLAPSPVADAKAKSGLNFVGSLHGLCETGSFPQAVLVAKRQVLQRKGLAVKKLIENLNGVNTYLSGLTAKEICVAITSKHEKGLTPMYNENNLNSLTIERANINYVSVTEVKNQINSFIQKVKNVKDSAVKIIPDSFYYGGVL